MSAKELEFRTTVTSVFITYAKATSKEYQQYYKENIDSDLEIDGEDMPEYDGYIVSIGEDGVPAWYNETEFINTFIDVEVED